MTQKSDSKARPFEIFRASDAIDLSDDECMDIAPFTETEQHGMASLMENGFLDGARVKVLYSRPGMSLTYVWFKSGYPLPMHSHSADCLYFIISGSLKLGTETLGPGDGFFLGTDVPYSYVPGDDGMELLEFRSADKFDFKMHANNKGYWEKMLANLLTARERWPEEPAPSGMEVGSD